MIFDRYTKGLLTVLALALTTLAVNAAWPIQSLRTLIAPSSVSAQSKCPAIAKATIPRNYKLVGSWMPMNVPRPDPRLVFETDDSYWFVAAEHFYKNLESGDAHGCVHLQVKKG